MTLINNAQRILSAIIIAGGSNAQAAVQTINFDSDPLGNAISAPSLFSAATPLTDLYTGQGVTFAALNRTTQAITRPKDGIDTVQSVNVINAANTGMGAILNESANFGHNAKSGDNFLAFNNQSSSSANFWRISFADPIGYFGISYSNGSSSTYQYLNFEAYDVNGNLIGSRNNNYLGNYDYYQSNFFTNAFKSETEISYIDIGQGLECCGNNLTSNLRTGTWSLSFDDLDYGDFIDAPYYTYSLTNNGGGPYVPLPSSVWLMLSALLGFFRLNPRQAKPSVVPA